MPVQWKPIAAITCLVALLAWLGTLVPGATQPAGAEPSAGVPDLANQFVVFHEGHDDDDEHEHDEDWDEEEEDEDWDEDEWDEEELEREHTYAEVHRTELELLLGEMRVVREVAEIASDPDHAATMVILTLSEEIDDADDFEPLMLDLLSRTKSATVKRLIRMELAERYGREGEDEKALEQVRAIISDD